MSVCALYPKVLFVFSFKFHHIGLFARIGVFIIYLHWWCPWNSNCLSFFGNTFYRFYFDFSPTYVGCGLICPRIVNCSVLLGAIVSWGFLWPYISQHAGDWYPADLGNSDFKGLYGYKVWWITLIRCLLRQFHYSLRVSDFFLSYVLRHANELDIYSVSDLSFSCTSELVKLSPLVSLLWIDCSPNCFLQVFIAISLILGDGLYNLIKIISVTFKELCNKRTKVSKLPIDNEIQGANECSSVAYENLTKLFCLEYWLKVLLIMCPQYSCLW